MVQWYFLLQYSLHCVSILLQKSLMISQGMYQWPPVWLVWNQQYDNWNFLFLFAKQTNPNQSKRRSTVQWYFPLQYSLHCVSLLLQKCLMISQGMYQWPVWLVWNQQYDNWNFLCLFTKHDHPNQSNRRSTVQCYSPLWYFLHCISILVWHLGSLGDSRAEDETTDTAKSVDTDLENKVSSFEKKRHNCKY